MPLKLLANTPSRGRTSRRVGLTTWNIKRKKKDKAHKHGVFGRARVVFSLETIIRTVLFPVRRVQRTTCNGVCTSRSLKGPLVKVNDVRTGGHAREDIRGEGRMAQRAYDPMVARHSPQRIFSKNGPVSRTTWLTRSGHVVTVDSVRVPFLYDNKRIYFVFVGVCVSHSTDTGSTGLCTEAWHKNNILNNFPTISDIGTTVVKI